MRLKSRILAYTLVCMAACFACNPAGPGDKSLPKVEGPREIISQEELHAMDLVNHDVTMPFIRLGKDDYWIYLTEGGKTDGQHSHIIRARTTVTEVNTDETEDVPIYGIPDANVNEFNGWKAWMLNMYEIDSDEWLAILHLEDQDERFTELFRNGIAYSNDDGRSFQFLGFILSPDLPDSIVKMGNCKAKINIAGAGLRWDDRYFYAYYSDLNTEDLSDLHLGVARADKQEVINNARLGKNTPWYKYYEGEWNEPGMEGHSSSIGWLGAYHTTMMYNTYIKKWIMINITDGAITLRRSEDPLNFDVEDEFLCEVPEGYMADYCSIMPHQADMTQCGREFYIFYRLDHREDGVRIFDVYNMKVIL